MYLKWLKLIESNCIMFMPLRALINITIAYRNKTRINLILPLIAKAIIIDYTSNGWY